MDFNEVMDRVSLVIEKKLGMKPKDNVIAKYLDISPTNYRYYVALAQKLQNA